MKQAILQAIIIIGLLRVLYELGWHGVALGAFAVVFYKAFTD